MIPVVDRSHRNDPYPLRMLIDKGIKFCWYKAAQALQSADKVFNDSWQEAKAQAGFLRGAYFFFDPRYGGKEQCDNFLAQQINFSGIGCLGGCVDVEDLVVFGPDGKEDPVETAAANKWVADNTSLVILRLRNFLDCFKEATGRDCVIYTYNNYMREYYRSAPFPNNPMWLSSLQKNCPVRYDTGKLPEFWQYTYNWSGSDMDGNYFTGTMDELNALAGIKAN